CTKILHHEVLEKRKGVEDLAADHLSRIENSHMEVLSEREIADELLDKHLMLLTSKFNDDEPWSDFESWQQRIPLYCLGKENGENILKSINEGLFKMGKFRETLAKGVEGALHIGPERDRVFADLTPEEKERFKADIHATNILLQGLPKDIYTLINHYTDAKDIWDNVKMLLEGSEFTKLIYDSRNIKMTMPKMQLNSKFVNNMLPEWGRFMNTVRLNKGLKTSNYDQWYTYFKQHKAHVNENKMMLERYNQHAIDPLAFVSNVSPQKGAIAAGNRGVQYRVGNGRQTNTFNDDVDEELAQDLALNEDNIFQANQCDASDSDVDEAPTTDHSALYNGHEIVKTNHAPAVIHDLEDTLEIAEITRKRMLENVKSPLCVENKVKFAPLDYSKENYLATFTPQIHLTLEQIFWSSDIAKIIPNPILAMTLQGKNNTIRKLKEQISHINERRSEAYRTLNFKDLDSHNIKLTERVIALQEQNERFRAENEKVKQHYKELYDSIKITCAKTIEKTTSLLTKNKKLKAQLKGKMQRVTMLAVKPKVLAFGMYAIDVQPIPPRNRNNREVYLDYLKHLKESA
nr:hypothetical protein [Tanacetum cinerariifolium]